MAAAETLQRMLDAALAAVEPRAATERALERHAGEIATSAGRLWVVGAGKAAAGMTAGALAALGEVAGGSIAVPAGLPVPRFPGITVWSSGHPVPTTHSLAAGADALATARRAAAGDLVLCLLSGGASSLWACPPPEVPLTDLSAATAALLRSGRPIDEVNLVRRHLSRIGGGGLARAAAPARVVTLALSDVIGSPLEAIGSGPAVPDPGTFAGALEVALRVEGIPASVRRHLAAGAAGEVPETAKPGEACFSGCSAFVIAENRDAVAAAARAAQAEGYAAEVAAEPLQGEAREAAERIATRVRAGGTGAWALLLGGETTVTVRGEGRGGRNQELALALAVELAGVEGWAAAAFGTDGVDGFTPAAGARVDGGTVARGAAAGVDAARALAANDSYGFFAREGGAIVTGPTGTNVGDLVVVLLAPA